MILGNMNGYHETWGSRSKNSRGSIIVSIANQCDLTSLNDGSITFSRGPVESAIDVSLLSAAITNRFHWSIEDESRGNIPILLTLGNTSVSKTTRRPRWLYADLPDFQETIDRELVTSPPFWTLDSRTQPNFGNG